MLFHSEMKFRRRICSISLLGDATVDNMALLKECEEAYQTSAINIALLAEWT